MNKEPRGLLAGSMLRQDGTCPGKPGRFLRLIYMDKQYHHYVFKTYKGKSTLLDEEMIAYLGKTFEEISKEKGFPLLAYNILEDHVHLLVRQSSLDNTNYVMRVFKGASSRYLFKQYPTNRYEHRKLWGRGYYSEVILEEHLLDKIDYIKNQKDSKGVDKRY